MSAKPDAAATAAELLALPSESGVLAWPDAPLAWLRARPATWLRRLRQRPVLEQGFRPLAAALERDGWAVERESAGRFPLLLVSPPRQREAARAQFARALGLLAPGGRVLAAVPNAEGARSAEADLATLAGPVQTLSKHHCRVFWTAPLDPATLDQARIAAWQALDAPRPIEDGRFLSRPGVFAWDRIDAASALLADCLDPGLAGEAADLGCGWGYLGHALLSRCPGIAALDGFEAEAAALELARHNLAPFASRVRLGFHWHDVRAGLPGRYDLILSNPPFHQGRAAEPALGQAFIAAAAEALRPGGRLLLVANAHLPYEAALRARFSELRLRRAEAGFKVYEAQR